MFRLLCLVALTTTSVLALGRTQSVGVVGKLLCNDKPAAGVKIKLYDEDKLSPDEKMAEVKSGADGSFDIRGHASEFTSIEPKINFYHDCDDGIKPCQRKITVYIPDKYISSGETPNKIFDFGVLQLAGKFSGETRDCIN